MKKNVFVLLGLLVLLLGAVACGAGEAAPTAIAKATKPPATQTPWIIYIPVTTTPAPATATPLPTATSAQPTPRPTRKPATKVPPTATESAPTVPAASPTPALNCPSPGTLQEPLERDQRQTKVNGGDSIIFRWSGPGYDLATDLDYAVHFEVRNSTGGFVTGGIFTHIESERGQTQLVVDKKQVPNSLNPNHDDNMITWWVTVFRITGLNEYGNLTGTDCSPLSNRATFQLLFVD